MYLLVFINLIFYVSIIDMHNCDRPIYALLNSKRTNNEETNLHVVNFTIENFQYRFHHNKL